MNVGDKYRYIDTEDNVDIIVEVIKKYTMNNKTYISYLVLNGTESLVGLKASLLLPDFEDRFTKINEDSYQQTVKRRKYTDSKQFAFYKGDKLLAMGTIQEIAEELNMDVETLIYYGRPSYIKRREEQKADQFRVLVDLDDDEELI